MLDNFDKEGLLVESAEMLFLKRMIITNPSVGSCHHGMAHPLG